MIGDEEMPKSLTAVALSSSPVKRNRFIFLSILQFYSNKNLRKITLSEIFHIYFIMASFAVNPSREFSFT